MDRFAFDDRTVVAQAEKMNSIADNLKKLCRKDLADALDTISVSWEGESAEYYLSKGENLRERITATSQSLERLADEVRAAARRKH